MQPSSPFSPVSPEAHAISSLFITTLIIGGVILALVVFLVIYASIRFRSRPGQGEPYQEFGRTHLEIAWTVAPAILLAVLFYLTVRGMTKSDPSAPAGQKPDLVVTAHQWWWELNYPNLGFVAANEIHLPVGRRFYVRIESADVIHSFWIPQLGRKMDAIPGHPNHIWIEADRPGEYQGTCSEYCGAQHAYMRLLAIAQPPDEFDAWARQQAQYPSGPSGQVGIKGEELFGQLTCINCHVVQRIGPDLSHVATRQTIGAGVLQNTPANLTRWLKNPQAIKPGSHMPDMKLTDKQVKELVAYLETQK